MQYCPTEKMAADFSTKPLQGPAFKRLSAVVMGETPLAEFMGADGSISKERVGDSGGHGIEHGSPVDPSQENTTIPSQDG